MMTVHIVVHSALHFSWQEEPQYQGYHPETITWKDVAKEFEKEEYGIDNPLRLSLVKGDARLIVDVCACKMAGQMLPLSTKVTPLESQFALCIVRQGNHKKIAITF